MLVCAALQLPLSVSGSCFSLILSSFFDGKTKILQVFVCCDLAPNHSAEKNRQSCQEKIYGHAANSQLLICLADKVVGATVA